MNESSAFTTILFFSLSLLLTGCATPDVKYSDLQPASTAAISSNTLTLHLGSDLTASACWTRPKVKIEGQTVYVVGYRTFREQNREFTVKLPAPVNAQNATVVWVDPDGSHINIPLKK